MSIVLFETGDHCLLEDAGFLLLEDGGVVARPFITRMDAGLI